MNTRRCCSLSSSVFLLRVTPLIVPRCGVAECKSLLNLGTRAFVHNSTGSSLERSHRFNLGEFRPGPRLPEGLALSFYVPIATCRRGVTPVVRLPQAPAQNALKCKKICEMRRYAHANQGDLLRLRRADIFATYLVQYSEMAHESFQRAEQIKGSSNRSFGIVFATVFAIVGLLPLIFGSAPRAWALALAGGFALAALAVPGILAPLNRLWLKFGLLLHRVVSPLVLGIMFFLVLTPTGLLMRLLGKDPLRLRFDKDAASYWIDRTPPGPPPESLKDQF